MYYRIFKHKITIENVDVESFGVEVYEETKLVSKLFDVSTDYNALLKLINSLNENEIDIIHLDAILEDFYLDNV